MIIRSALSTCTARAVLPGLAREVESVAFQGVPRYSPARWRSVSAKASVQPESRQDSGGAVETADATRQRSSPLVGPIERAAMLQCVLGHHPVFTIGLGRHRHEDAGRWKLPQMRSGERVQDFTLP